MSKSKSRKHCEKLAREGRRDPRENRVTQSGLHERKTKTKREKLAREEKKERTSLRELPRSRCSFLFF